MKRRTKMIIFGISAIMLGGSLAACGHKYKDPEQRVQWVTDKIASKLELNAEQRVKLDELSNTILKAKNAHQKDREQNRQAVLALLQAETLDQDKALSMITEKTRFVDQQAPTIVSAYAEFHNLLSDEQRAKIGEHLSDRFEHRGHRCHHKSPL